jgi:hypothetical protein
MISTYQASSFAPTFPLRCRYLHVSACCAPASAADADGVKGQVMRAVLTVQLDIRGERGLSVGSVEGAVAAAAKEHRWLAWVFVC